MKTTFDHITDAEAAGYVRCSSVRGSVERDETGGPMISVIDVSGGCSRGYDYAVAVFIRGAWHETARSVTVWGDMDKNMIGGVGAFCVMFAPGEYERGVSECRAMMQTA